MSSPAPTLAAALLAELCATFILVLAGTGAIVVNDVSGGAITHPGIALTFGLVVLAMIQTFGPISGAHMNPAVTLGLTAAHRFPAKRLVPYWASQLAGALLASLLLRLLFPQHEYLGGTRPSGTAFQSLVFELVLTLILMLAVLRLPAAPSGNVHAGLTIGAVIALEAMFAGPICGASMNPARSLGPALVSVHFESLWIYLIAPFVGALLAIPINNVVSGRDSKTGNSHAA